jgi:tetratricopeptide (TPR) repeat protein
MRNTMRSSIDIARPGRLPRAAVPLFVTVCLVAATAILILLPSGAAAQVPPAKIYYSDLLRFSMHDPAFADSGYKTRRDVLTGVAGPETWVEHFVSGPDTIETLTYNDLTYGVVVKKKDGANLYYTLNDDRKTYTPSGAETPSGWTIKNPPSYADIIREVKTLIDSRRYNDVTTYITQVMRDTGTETAEIYFYLGFAYDQLDEVSYAKLQYRRAISLDPTIADAYYNLGVIYRNEGDAAEAIGLLERYLVLNPTDPNAADIRGYIDANK